MLKSVKMDQTFKDKMDLRSRPVILSGDKRKDE